MSAKLQTILVFVVFLALASMQANADAAMTDPYLDEIVSWNDVSPFTSDDLNIVLGPPDGNNGFTISSGDELIVAFTNNIAVDGSGNDIYLYENVDASTPETLDVWASIDNLNYVYLGNARNDEGYDLSNYEDLSSIKYLKLIGTSTGGSSPGYDLLGVEALNSVPIPGAAFLLVTGLIGLVGVRRRLGIYKS